MAEEVGIVMTLYDRVSPTLKSITGNSKAFDKSLDELEASLKAYDKAQGELVDQFTSLKKALAETDVKVKDAQKSYRKLKDEASKGALDEAIDEQARLRRELGETETAIKENSAAYQELYKRARQAAAGISAAENRAGSSGMGLGGLAKGLAAAGIGQLWGDALGEIGNAVLSSAIGEPEARVVSSFLSGAVSGGAMGAMLGPVGIVAGAAAGGLAGLVSGGSEVYAAQDDAFKSYYQELYQQGQTQAENSLKSGSDTASQRELDVIAFNRLLGEGVGDAYLSDLRALAADTPMEYADLTAMSRALATGFGDAPERMLELMTAIGDAGSAVGVTADDMAYMAQSMSRMQSSGKATLEYLNIFQERGVNVVGMLSEAMGRTQGEIYDMISKGEISGQAAVDIIQAGMQSMYGGAMDTMAQTFSGLTSTLEDAMTEIDAARGEGYNETRSGGLQAEINAYGGVLGEAVENLNRISGQNEAYLENLSDRFTREALGAVLLGQETTVFSPEQQAALEGMRDEFIQASAEYENGSQEAGIKMENLRQEAEALATAAYESSDAYQMVHDTELDLISAIRDNTAALDGWRNDYELQQEQSKGRGLTGLIGNTAVSRGTGRSNYHDLGYNTEETSSVRRSNYHAYGLDRVPYDGYAAVLHQGERVLTAREAREADRGHAPIQITITGNEFGAGVSAEEMAQRLADALELKLAAGRVST